MNQFITIYRNILRLHRKLPIEHRALGDNYVKEEFARHRSVKQAEQANAFYKEWTIYCQDLSEQLMEKPAEETKKFIGKNLNLEMHLSNFNDDQLDSLLELKKQTNI